MSHTRFTSHSLKKVGEYAEKVSKAVRDLIPDAKVYVIGGVAEGRVTIYSDIDLLVVVKDKAYSVINPELRLNFKSLVVRCHALK